MWLYFLGIAKTSCSSFILPQEAFFFHCLLLLERFKGPGFLFCTGIAEAHPVQVLYCCAAEPRPADETGEAEQGSRSEFSSALHARWKFRAPQPDPPNKAYPNPILYEEGFGYVFSLSEVFRRGYAEG